MHRKVGGGGGCSVWVGGSRHRLMKFYFPIKIYCACDLRSPKGETSPTAKWCLKAVFSFQEKKKKVFFLVFILVLCFVEFPAVPSSLFALIKSVEEVVSGQTVCQYVLSLCSLSPTAWYSCYCYLCSYMCDIRGTHSGTVESTRLVGHGSVYVSTQLPTFRRSLPYCASD